MEIKRTEIRYWRCGGLYSVPYEGVRHVKVLPYLSIAQALEGSYDISLGGEAPQRTGEGGFFVAPADVRQEIVHHASAQSGRMSCRWVFLDLRINNAHTPDSLYRFPTVIRGADAAVLNEIFDRLFAAAGVWESQADCLRLVGALIGMATPVNNGTHRGVQNAVAYITEHYAEPISVETLAGISNMSASNFYAAFRKSMGSSPIAYLNHHRLSIAAERLTETDDTLSEIGYAVGIRDPLYLCRLFKKTYGVPPTEYRRIYRGG